MTNSSIAVLFFAAVLVTASAEIVSWKACPIKPNTTNVCTVHEVRVNPCKEAAQNKPCNLKKGENAKISFDFTPQFDASKLKSQAYWANELVDLPFMGMETDACKGGTTCPIKKDSKYIYNVELPISKEFPTRPFDVKWELWNADKRDELCCFLIQINLLK